ncbi:MAG: DUF4169 family protein [Pseudomonadota bacterium]
MTDDGKIISLSKARKQKRRAADKKFAAENRAAFGRTKTEKTRDAKAKARRDALLDGARTDDGEPS